MRGTSVERSRRELAERLRERRPEIEQATITRVYAIAEPSETADPEYLDGLRAALTAALDYAFAAVELGERTPPLPAVLLSQARLAARNGVSLDTVLRRYFSGFTLFGDFVLHEADAGLSLRGISLHRLLQTQAAQFDHLVAAISDEYRREEQSQAPLAEDRLLKRVRRLLGGELLDTSPLSYDFSTAHTGVVAAGPAATESLRDLATALGRSLLLVQTEEETVWAWLGGRHPLPGQELADRAASGRSDLGVLALGEPGLGMVGWRLTHRQAMAALPVALSGPEDVVCYGDVPLLCSVLRDDLLASSLRELFLVPLEAERDGGEAARATLRAYFAAERNVSSAAAALGVNRNTVASRLRAIEELLGRSLATCATELECALRLRELGEERTRREARQVAEPTRR